MALVYERLVGGMSLIQATATHDVPCDVEIYRRMAVDPEFFAAMARAREAQQHAEVEKMIKIADDATPETVHVATLRIRTRQWRAGQLAPRFYGTKIAHVGPDNGPIKIETSDTEAARRIAFTLARAAQSLPDKQE